LRGAASFIVVYRRLYWGMVARRQKFAIAGMVCALAAGCGLKGPLYMPHDQQRTDQESTTPSSAASGQRKRQTSPVPAPQSQKKETTTVSPTGETTTWTPDPDPSATPTTPPPDR
jgi:predicted small lipoprotein YifL